MFSDHRDLPAKVCIEQAFGDHGVDSAHNIYDLGHAKTYGDAAQRVGVQFGEAGAGGQELDGVARGSRFDCSSPGGRQ